MSFAKQSGGGGADPQSPSTNDLFYERRESFVYAGPPAPKPGGGGRRRSTVGNMVMTTESIKERQVQVTRDLSKFKRRPKNFERSRGLRDRLR